MNLLVVFDDTICKSELVNDIIGSRGFSDVIVKRKRLESFYKDALSEKFGEIDWITVKSVFEFNNLVENVEKDMGEYRVLHCFSNFIISEKEKALLSFEKIQYIRETYKAISNDELAMLMFPQKEDYKKYLLKVCKINNSILAAEGIEGRFEIEGFVNIGKIENFIKCVSGNFDARFFNSINGNEYVLTKSSSNIKKIKAEYEYYHLLPDDMKMWFVMPFNYQENGEKASYSMERLHMTDLAIKWVHGSIGIDEFYAIMEKYFYFLNSRHKKQVSESEYHDIAKDLYETKVLDRVEKLKSEPAFDRIKQSLYAGKGTDIDSIVKRYFEVKNAVEKREKFEQVSVIGHGDPCFANTMYNKATKMLKFIDPKGAIEEKELWTNPYYDVAKISHSVCGLYDYFNNALFDIKINDSFDSELFIDFDNSEYVKIFRQMIEKNNYDYLTVRVYEVSLFISMLPLHIDYPHKVFAFILNAIKILDDIEKEL